MEIKLSVEGHEVSDVLMAGTCLLSVDEVCVETRDVELSWLPADHIAPSLRPTEHPVWQLLLGQDSVPDIDVSQGSVVRLIPVQEYNVLQVSIVS